MKPVYLDYNATTPHAPEVIAAMRPFLETEFGNPSSGHWYGIAPLRAVQASRQQVAESLGCSASEIIFTSGGTESNNHAIKGTARALREKGTHIITTAVEHPAVLEVCRYLETTGFQVTVVPVDPTGRVRVQDVAAAVRPETILISVMHANNEIGTIQPIPEIADIAKQHGIVMHTDAAQSMGKISTRVDELGVDLLSLAGHKLYAPKGVGALFVRKSRKLEKFCHGAGQEHGWRAGTENVLEVAGLGKACEIAHRDIAENRKHMQAMCDRLRSGLLQLPDAQINGHPDARLPNTLSISFRGLEANRLLDEIGLDVAASAGAACHADTVEISHVLTAMKIPKDLA
jgi:cysteine desulfurase